jgi:hypothetical protein
MNSNVLPSDRATLLATIDPDAYGAGTVVSDYVSLADFESLQAIVMVGEMQATSTVDAKLLQATDSSGTGAKDITGKAITQLTAAGTDDDKQAIINCRSEELDVANSFTHVALSMTTATAASDSSGLILGHSARYQPATDLSSVDEVIA